MGRLGTPITFILAKIDNNTAVRLGCKGGGPQIARNLESTTQPSNKAALLRASAPSFQLRHPKVIHYIRISMKTQPDEA